MPSIAQQRLATQRLSGKGFTSPADVVRWFGAVQAQDYPGALWALGLRTNDATEASIEQAVADRTIVRSWPLRGTLHFVAPEDLRWMLTHFSPRTIQRAAPRFRQLELDARVLARGSALVIKALEGGRQVTRQKIYELLERAGIATAENRGIHILWRCAHDGLICFAVREGKQHTVALLEEWIPGAKAIDRDEALAELARRYFASHGPAAIEDFTWWSGLSAPDARRALDVARPRLRSATIGGTVYWLGGAASLETTRRARTPHAALLPPYDEYTVAYRDRSAALDPRHAVRARNGIFSPTILLDGRIVGTWTRRVLKGDVASELATFARLTGDKARAVAAAADRFRRFVSHPFTTT